MNVQYNILFLNEGHVGIKYVYALYISVVATETIKMVSETSFDVHSAAKWVSENVVFDVQSSADGELQIEAATIFPSDERTVYELLTHPDNYEIFRGVSRSTFRRMLSNDGLGNQLIEVENESDWNVLGLVRGSIKSRLIVEQSMSEGYMHFTNTPNSSSLLKEMYGRWSLYGSQDTRVRDLLPSSPRTAEFIESDACIVTLYQRFVPNKIPKVLYRPFHKSACFQIRRTFEDLILELWRIQAGMGSLPPYMSSCMKEIKPSGDETASTEEPESAIAVLEAASNSSGFVRMSSKAFPSHQLASKIKSKVESNESNDTSGSSMDYSSSQYPLSHPLLSWSASSLQLHEIPQGRDIDDTIELFHHTRLHRFMKRVHSLVDRYFSVDEETELLNDDGYMDYDPYELPGPWLVVA